MKILQGMAFNFKGLMLGLKTPSLLALGLARFAVIFVLTIVAIGIILSKYQEIANLIWSRPESAWLVWLWYLISWLLALLLSGLSSIVAFLIAQVLFSVIIMDYMSRITERKIAGSETAAPDMPMFAYFFYLIKQEIPRAALPVTLSLILMLIGWFTPLSPILTIASPLVACVFLAWDHTDLVPARRMKPFRQRFRIMRKHLGFHIGFGLCFLIPALNILLLSFAPVGATIYFLQHIDAVDAQPSASPQPLQKR